MNRAVAYVQPHLSVAGGSTPFRFQSPKVLRHLGWDHVIVTQCASLEIVDSCRSEVRILGGPADSGINGKTCVHFATEDSSDLSALKVRMIEDPEGASQMSARARSHVESVFTGSSCVDVLSTMFKQITRG